MSKAKQRRRRSLGLADGTASCAGCGTRDNLTIDHVLPKSRGGKNALANLQVLCSPCNNAKSDGDSVPPPPRPRRSDFLPKRMTATLADRLPGAFDHWLAS